MTTIAVFHDPWQQVRDAPVSIFRPLMFWKKAICYRANPRALGYVKALLDELSPGAELVNIKDDHVTTRLRNASRIVLLYPDAIGLGFLPIERQVHRLAPNAHISVLNGRRRQFAFDAKTGRALRLRRFLEWTMLVEGIVGIVILISTPFLLLADLVRGRT